MCVYSRVAMMANLTGIFAHEDTNLYECNANVTRVKYIHRYIIDIYIYISFRFRNRYLKFQQKIEFSLRRQRRRLAKRKFVQMRIKLVSPRRMGVAVQQRNAAQRSAPRSLMNI